MRRNIAGVEEKRGLPCASRCPVCVPEGGAAGILAAWLMKGQVIPPSGVAASLCSLSAPLGQKLSVERNNLKVSHISV